MKIETYKCDVCGVQKGETNHWFKVIFVAGGDGMFLFPAHRECMSSEGKEFDLCGQQCVQRKVEEYIGSLPK